MMVLLTEISPGCSSSSSSTHDHDHRNYTYHVFLSFRGADTRNGFTSHLYRALLDAGINTFLDDEEIDTGEALKPELEGAIKSSRASIIVLSKNYASSTWCLDELVLILEQMRNFNQIIIPIFYDVEPTHVRKQQNSFGEAMEKHKKRIKEETNEEKRSELAQKMEAWKMALKQVADLKGKDAKDRKDLDLIEEVVNDIHHRLGAHLWTLPLLIGVERHIKSITSWLTDGSCHGADILTIVGMSGIGKTSLARYIFRLYSHEFHKSSFIEGINARYNECFNGLLKLQKQLYRDITKKTQLQVNDISMYTSKIEDALARKRVFIVLDDIGSLKQLDSLLGNKGLHQGSKIIITTKDASLTEKCALFNPQVQPKHKKVSLNGLDEWESRELLCIHAFKSKFPKEGYTEVSKKLVKYCDGHPLALQVLGSSLQHQSVTYWEDFINVLKKETHFDINTTLRMSFDALPFKNDKELFKHIACFFVGIDRDVTEMILNACDINTKSGITNLINRCLLRIGWDNELMMHQLVQQMGRDLVCQESPYKPWERSRLWCHDESFEVLKQQKGTGNLFGLALDMRMLEKEQLSGSLQLKTDALSKMNNLKLLQLNYVKISGSYKNISKELRWLCMHGCCFKSIPSELPMENLVVLDMSHSNIESFDVSCSSSKQFMSRLKGLIGSSSNDKRLLGSLKILDLSFCEQLHTVCGFFELPALEKLIMSNCTSLIQVSESIKHCVELVFIDLSNCKKLKKLPGTIGKLKKLEILISNGCSSLVFPTEMRDMDSLHTFEAENIGMNSKASSSSAIVEIIPRDLRSFARCLPISLVRLSLKNNNLSNKSFPMDLSSLSMLKTLNLAGNPIVSMPSCVRTLPRLEVLTMWECKLLETVENPPSSLKMLEMTVGYKLQEMKFNLEMAPLLLKFLELIQGFVVIEGIINVQALTDVEDEVLCRLGWANFELIKYQHLTINRERFRIQMFYEFGIFSTIYGGKEMPNWISCRSKGSSMSFTIPSSPNKLIGVNICCYVQGRSFRFPIMVVSNITKTHTWIYEHNVGHVSVDGEEGVIYLSHWMFGKNEMEDGDQLTINIAHKDGLDVYSFFIRECGLGLVYDNERMKEEDDVLGYYKSWNHIIGGDLSQFQTTTGEYILNYRYFLHGPYIQPSYDPFIAENARGKRGILPQGIRFKAFSQQRSDLVVRPRESRGVVPETMRFKRDRAKMMESLRTKITILEFIYNMFKSLKVRTRSHLCFSLKLYTLSRFLRILYIFYIC